MSWLTRLFAGSPKEAPSPTAPEQTSSSPVSTSASRRTYVLSGLVPCAEFSSDGGRHAVDVTTGPEDYAALLDAWAEDKPERLQTVYLRPDPETRNGVVVQRPAATTLGRLSPRDAGRYRGLIEAVMELGLTCTATAKTSGAGDHQRLKLSLNLDDPRQIGRDFHVTEERLTPRLTEDGESAAEIQSTMAAGDSIRGLPADHPRYVAVVGESHYQLVLQRMAAESRAARVTIEGEPSNAYDRGAVRVANDAGETVGYLAKGQYTKLKQLARATPLVCQAELKGGTTETPAIGLVVDLGEEFRTSGGSD